MWDMGDGMGWWMLIGSIWFVIFWGAIIWLVFTAIDRLAGRRGEGGGDSAIEIARRRYARGEISREEFERIKRDLEI